MPTQTLTRQDVLDILEIARFAPSVHNTQPWKVSWSDTSVTVSLDPEHLLSDGDPTGRETIISLGIFTEAIVIAAKKCGFESKSVSYKDKSSVIVLTKKSSTPSDSQTVALLTQRCTDRSIYTHTEITATTPEDIKKSGREKDVSVWVTTDEATIQKTAQLTSQGIGVALSSPNFRKELSSYLAEPWSRSNRGISVNSLYIPKIIAYLEPIFMRLGIGLGAEVKLEKRRWLSASGIVFIAAKGDMPEYWFQVGRDYLRISLQIERAGLSQATSAATVEASNFHEDIEEMLGTDYRLQCVIRFGNGKKSRAYSPRISAEALLST